MRAIFTPRSSIITAIRGRLSALTKTALRFHVGTGCFCLVLIGSVVEIGKIFVLLRRTSDYGRDLNVEFLNGLCSAALELEVLTSAEGFFVLLTMTSLSRVFLLMRWLPRFEVFVRSFNIGLLLLCFAGVVFVVNGIKVLIFVCVSECLADFTPVVLVCDLKMKPRLYPSPRPHKARSAKINLYLGFKRK